VAGAGGHPGTGTAGGFAMTTGDTHTTATADQLWAALHQARTDIRPRTLAHVEDALFRHYLPMARSMAAEHAPDHPDPDGLQQTAEVGLARAILAWTHGPAGFNRFARNAITHQLHHHDTLTRRDGRFPPVPVPPSPDTPEP
jgi:hypothetical protein